MHSYSTDVSRLKIISKIGAASFLVSLLLIKLFNTLIQKILTLAPYLDKTPYISSLTIFGVSFTFFYFVFDKVLWKISIKGTTLSKTPNLRGKWSGYVIVKRDGKRAKTYLDIEIKQTWTLISITLKTKNSSSRSRSVAASIFTSEDQLIYYYFNVPCSTYEESMHKHYGVTTLNIIENKKLEGEYFNCPDRGTYGDIFLEKMQ